MLVIAQNKRVILIQTGLVGGGWWGWGDKSEGISFWKPKVLCSGIDVAMIDNDIVLLVQKPAQVEHIGQEYIVR